MKLGNILINGNISVSQDFNVISNMSDIIPDIPTLIVGFEYVNKNYPDFNITDIEIKPNLYWTFKRTEKRDKFEQDLRWFTTKIYQNLVSKINYVFVDPIHHNSRDLIKIFRKIKKINRKITYVNGEMIYIYGENLIFGVDLTIFKYAGTDIVRLKNKIKDNSTVFLENNEILIEYKNIVGGLNNEIKYLPFIYSIRNEENTATSIVHTD